MAPVATLPKWTPTAAHRAVFNEWKDIALQHLVSCKKGIQPHKLPGMLEEVAGKVPFDKMGFGYTEYRLAFLFLYHMRDDLEFRRVDDKQYVFIRESSVPSEMVHIRALVLGQKGKMDKPLKHHGMNITAMDVLRSGTRPPAGSVPFIPPPQRPQLSRNYNRGRSRPSSSSSSPSAAARPNFNRKPGTSTSQSRPVSTNSIAHLKYIPPTARSTPMSMSSSFTSKPTASTGSYNNLGGGGAKGNGYDDWDLPSAPARPSTATKPTPAYTRHVPVRFLAGLEDDDDSSDDDEFGMFDVYCGPKKSSSPAKKTEEPGPPLQRPPPLLPTLSSLLPPQRPPSLFPTPAAVPAPPIASLRPSTPPPASLPSVEALFPPFSLPEARNNAESLSPPSFKLELESSYQFGNPLLSSTPNSAPQPSPPVLATPSASVEELKAKSELAQTTTTKTVGRRFNRFSPLKKSPVPSTPTTPSKTCGEMPKVTPIIESLINMTLSTAAKAEASLPNGLSADEPEELHSTTTDDTKYGLSIDTKLIPTTVQKVKPGTNMQESEDGDFPSRMFTFKITNIRFPQFFVQNRTTSFKDFLQRTGQLNTFMAAM